MIAEMSVIPAVGVMDGAAVGKTDKEATTQFAYHTRSSPAGPEPDHGRGKRALPKCSKIEMVSSSSLNE